VAAKRIGCCSLLSSSVQGAGDAIFFSSAARWQPASAISTAAAAEMEVKQRLVSDMVKFLEGKIFCAEA
jgi:hypothetical protein